MRPVAHIAGGPFRVFLVMAFLAGCMGAAHGASLQLDRAHAAYGAAWLHIHDARRLDVSNPESARESWNRALSLLEQAWLDDPYASEVARALAICYLRFGKVDEAARALVESRYLGRTPSDMGDLALLDRIPLPRRVVRAYDIVLAHDKLPTGKRPEVLNDVGAYCLRHGLSKDSLRFFTPAVESRPDDVALLRFAVVACTQTKDYDLGIEMCLRFLKQQDKLDSTESLDILGRLASFYEGSARAAEGMDVFRGYLKKAPDSEMLVRLYVLLLDRAGQVDKAMETAAAFVEKHPDSVALKLISAELNAKSNPEVALDMLRRIAEQHPTEWRARTLLAYLDWDAGRREEALRTLQTYSLEGVERTGDRITK